MAFLRQQVRQFIGQNPDLFQPLTAELQKVTNQVWDQIESKWRETMVNPWSDDVFRMIDYEMLTFDWDSYTAPEDIETAPLLPDRLSPDDGYDYHYDAQRERERGKRYGPYRD
jgi:hypothetical protein